MIIQNEVKSYGSQAVAVIPRSGSTFIEQLQIASTKRCEKDKRPYLVGVNENQHTVVLCKPDCKMWNCEACAAKNARRWIAKVINGVNKLGGQWYFLTLTAHRKTRKLASIKNLRDGWKKFYNRVLAAYGKTSEKLFYCKVWEQHEEGSFHLHTLTNFFLGERWAKDNAAQCGMGFQADWHEIDNAGKIAGYMAKYSLKNAHIARGGIQWPKGLRRIETSREWPNLPELSASEEMGWIVKLSREGQCQSAQRYFIRGFEILDMVRGENLE